MPRKYGKKLMLWVLLLGLCFLTAACGRAPGGASAEATRSAGTLPQLGPEASADPGKSRTEPELPEETTAGNEAVPESGTETAPETAVPEETEASAEAGETEAETEPEGEPEAEPVQLKLASFNIKHCDAGVDTIAATLRLADADIVGLQEVDLCSERSGGEDQPRLLAEKAGYSYYRFIRAIDLMGGEYGTLILSRYPIAAFEVIQLDSGGGEGRSLGHALVELPGTQLHVYCTHLAYESRDVRREEMEFIAELLEEQERYALLGDLNSFVIEDIYYLRGTMYINRPDRFYATFSRFGSGPDNIVLSRGFRELDSGLLTDTGSDHNLLYALVEMEP